MLRLRAAALAACLAFASTGTLACPAFADHNRAEIDSDAANALQALYKDNPAARAISQKARAILVFPRITKAGFVFGAGYGEGELRRGTGVVDYFNSFTGSWGLQAGAQSYGYAVFLMTDKAEKYLNHSKGWEIGVGPTVVVIDKGKAANFSTTTLKDDAYAFIFDQEGLMAGLSIDGTKISKIKVK